MARRTPPPPLQVSRELHALQVYAPISDTWLDAWVQDGVLMTVTGPVPRHLPMRCDWSALDSLTAIQAQQLRTMAGRRK